MQTIQISITNFFVIIFGAIIPNLTIGQWLINIINKYPIIVIVAIILFYLLKSKKGGLKIILK